MNAPRRIGAPVPARPVGTVSTPRGSELIDRLRATHLEMIDAVVGGDGLDRVADLAARAVGAPVAVVIPRLGTAVVSASEPAIVEVGALKSYVVDRMQRRAAGATPEPIVHEVPIKSGQEILGAVLLLAEPIPALEEAAEFLQLAAVATITEVAIEEARHEVEESLRDTFLEELRSERALSSQEIMRRAGRLGCDLRRGAVVLCAETDTDRPRRMVTTITAEAPDALAQPLDGRIYAVLPAVGGDDAPERTLALARRIATRLQRHGPVGVSSFCSDPGELGRALEEAELVVEVLRESGGTPIAEEIGTGTYRLLFRVFASHPEEVRSFYDDTVAPIVRYDEQYGTDLVGTLEAYLEQNCNMNATAATLFAHRHTIAYRLDRVRELSGLDPTQSEHRERLGLGLKAYRILAPRLQR
jgi:sugar diacid utilization regulator